MKLGIQLYSVRDQIDKDITPTLAALKAMGFEGVEFAFNYGGLDPDAVAAAVINAGLVCCGIHTDLNSLMNPESRFYAYAAALSTPFVTVSCCGKEQVQNWQVTIASVASAARVARSKGYRFTYHNHAHEFEVCDGRTLLDSLYALTDPAEVEAELDTAWIYAGGCDPCSYIRRYAGRLPQVHAKDYSRDRKQLLEIGCGDLDFAAIVETAREAGATWLIYELDTSALGDSLISARESAAVLGPLVEENSR